MTTYATDYDFIRQGITPSDVMYMRDTATGLMGYPVDSLVYRICTNSHILLVYSLEEAITGQTIFTRNATGEWSI